MELAESLDIVYVVLKDTWTQKKKSNWGLDPEQDQHHFPLLESGEVHQYCFANISTTKAPNFMKFYVVINYYPESLYFKFHEDFCINARAQVVNPRACFIFSVHVYTLCTRIFARIFIKCKN